MEREKSKGCFVTTRQRAQEESINNDKAAKYIIEEKNGTILNKYNYDLLFHLIPIENDELKNKLMNKFGIANFMGKWQKYGKIHYMYRTSNQFANARNTQKTQDCIENILKYCQENKAQNNILRI